MRVFCVEADVILGEQGNFISCYPEVFSIHATYESARAEMGKYSQALPKQWAGIRVRPREVVGATAVQS